MRPFFNWHFDRIEKIQKILNDAEKAWDKQAFTTPTKETTNEIVQLCSFAVIELNKLINELNCIKNAKQYTRN